MTKDDKIQAAIDEAHSRQTNALKDDRQRDADFWDGYKRALKDVRDDALIEGPKF